MTKTEKDIRNIGLQLAIKKPNIYKTAILSGVMTMVTLFILLSIFEIKEGLDSIVLPVMIISLLYFYTSFIETYVLFRLESGFNSIRPLVVIGYSNLVSLIIDEEIEASTQADEIIIRESTSDELMDYYDEGVAIISCYKKDSEVIEFPVIGLGDYVGLKLIRNESKISEDIISEE